MTASIIFLVKKTENVYVNMDSRPEDGLDYMIHKDDRDCNTIWTGTRVEAHHEKAEHVEILKKYLDFIFLEKDEPRSNWYAVPVLSVLLRTVRAVILQKGMVEVVSIISCPMGR